MTHFKARFSHSRGLAGTLMIVILALAYPAISGQLASSGPSFPNAPQVTPDGHGGLLISGTNDSYWHLAYGNSATGRASSYSWPDISASTTDYIPPQGKPCVSVEPEQGGTGHVDGKLGNWSGFVCTSGSVNPTPTPTSTPRPTATPTSTPTNTPHPTPTPSPTGTPVPTPTPTGTPPPAGAMMVGLDDSWVSFSGYSEDKTAVNVVRIDSPTTSEIDSAASAGMKLDIIYGGYNSGGVSAIDAPSFASGLVSYYNGLTSTEKSTIVAIEVLNEPGNPYIGWGSSATSPANAAAYDTILVDIHNDFGTESHPKILASFDGGYGNVPQWGGLMMSADPSIGSILEGVTVHPYGGTSNATTSALGNRQRVLDAHNISGGVPVYVTEVGWPTDTGGPPTGDSMQWTETQQADNIYNFITWARSLGYVNEVIIFNGHDYGSNDFYGVYEQGGSPGNYKGKLSFTALGEAARQQACTVC